jgi:hypothetical protein
MRNAIFWDLTSCGSCKNRCFGRTYSLHHQDYLTACFSCNLLLASFLAGWFFLPWWERRYVSPKLTASYPRAIHNRNTYIMNFITAEITGSNWNLSCRLWISVRLHVELTATSLWRRRSGKLPYRTATCQQ